MLAARRMLDEEEDFRGLGEGAAPQLDRQAASGPVGHPRPKDSELLILRRDFGALAHYTDEMLLGKPVGELAVANRELAAASGRGDKSSIQSQMARNFQLAVTKMRNVAAGLDNQLSTLHPARFLPGVLCLLTELWVAARRHVPEGGLIPYANYDTASLGLTQHISERGWAILHLPGSASLSVKLFTPGAVKQSKQDKDDCGVAPADMDEFRRALNALRTAQSLVTPWNFSAAAIVCFLEGTGYCGKVHGGRDHAAKLVEFVDECLQENARRWRLHRHFLTMSELTAEWNVFTSRAGAAKFENDNGGRGDNGSRRQEKQRREPAKDGDFCFRYNNGFCPHADGKCTAGNGAKLRHRCMRKGSNGDRCDRRHPARDHK